MRIAGIVVNPTWPRRRLRRGAVPRRDHRRRGARCRGATAGRSPTDSPRGPRYPGAAAALGDCGSRMRGACVPFSAPSPRRSRGRADLPESLLEIDADHVARQPAGRSSRLDQPPVGSVEPRPRVARFTEAPHASTPPDDEYCRCFETPSNFSRVEHRQPRDGRMKRSDALDEKCAPSHTAGIAR